MPQGPRPKAHWGSGFCPQRPVQIEGTGATPQESSSLPGGNRSVQSCTESSDREKPACFPEVSPTPGSSPTCKTRRLMHHLIPILDSTPQGSCLALADRACHALRPSCDPSFGFSIFRPKGPVPRPLNVGDPELHPEVPLTPRMKCHSELGKTLKRDKTPCHPHSGHPHLQCPTVPQTPRLTLSQTTSLNSVPEKLPCESSPQGIHVGLASLSLGPNHSPPWGGQASIPTIPKGLAPSLPDWVPLGLQLELLQSPMAKRWCLEL